MTAPSSPRIDWRTLLLLLTPPLLWAGNFIAARALSNQVPPVCLSLIRWGLALLCLLPFALRPFMREYRQYWRYRWHVLGTSLTGVLAFNLLVYWGLHSTSATNGIILNSFIPFLVALFGFLFYRQRLPVHQFLGLLVSLAGVLTVVAHGDIHTLRNLAFAAGDMIIFLAMIFWALFTLWTKEIPASLDRSGLMLCQVLIALLVLIPLSLWESQHRLVTIGHAQTGWALVYIGIFPSVIAFLAYSKAVSRVGSVRASAFIHAMPIFGAILSTLLLQEEFHRYQLVGMLTIFAGIGLANRSSGRPSPLANEA